MLHDENMGMFGCGNETTVPSEDHSGGSPGETHEEEEQWGVPSHVMESVCSRMLTKGGESKVKEMGERKEVMGVRGEWEATVA